MTDLIYTNFEHFLLLLLLLTRGGDLLSTYIATPSLKLEANLISKKLGWKFGILSSVIFIFIPYYSTFAAVMLITTFSLVTISNFSMASIAHAIGEDNARNLSLYTWRKRGPRKSAFFIVVPMIFWFILAFLLIILHEKNTWAIPIAFGIIAFAVIKPLHNIIYIVKYRNEPIANKIDLPEPDTDAQTAPDG